MGAGNPEDLGPGGGGRERCSFEDGVGTRPQICVKHFPVLLWESLPRSLAACSSACVPVSLRVLRAHLQGMHDSLATCVILEPRVFIADFKYLFHGRQRHLVSFYNLLVVIE